MKKTIIDPVDDSQISFELVHEGIEGQKAWAVWKHFFSRLYYVEIVEYLNGTFAFHVERNEKYIADSRAAKTKSSYYNDFTKCYFAAVNEINNHRKKSRRNV